MCKERQSATKHDSTGEFAFPKANEITVATLQPFCRRKDSFTLADEYGAIVAHHDFAEAVVRAGNVRGLHLFQARASGVLGVDPIDDLRQLQKPDFLLERRSPLELPRLAGEHKYVFVDAGENALQISQCRRAARANFPICSVVHSIKGPCFPRVYLDLIFGLRFGDRLIATSCSARTCLLGLTETLVADLERFLTPQACATLKERIKIAPIPLAVDTEWFAPRDRRLSRDLLGLPPNATVILYVGRLTDRFKADLEPLLLVFRKLAKADHKMMLVLAGQDAANEYCPKITDLVRAFEISQQVRVIPNFAPPLKPLLYSSANIFVSPVDNIQETFGISILEAMSSGLPVVAADWSGYRDIVSHNLTGFLVPSIWSECAADTMSNIGMIMPPQYAEAYLAQQTALDNAALYEHLWALSTNKELATQLGIAGRIKVIKDFSFPTVMGLYERLWEEQYRDVTQAEKREESGQPLSWHEIFGHYATFHLRPDTRLCLKYDFRKGLSTAGTSNLESIRAACKDSPQKVGDLAAGNSGGLEAVVYALKKGYVDFL